MALQQLSMLHQRRSAAPAARRRQESPPHKPTRLQPKCQAELDPRVRDQLVDDVQQNRPYSVGDGQATGVTPAQDPPHEPTLRQRIQHAIFRDEPEVASHEGKAPKIPSNNITQDYTMTTQHAVVAQTMLELAEPRNIAVISALTSEIFGQIGRQLNSEAGRRGFRVLFGEVVQGMFKALEHKAAAWGQALRVPVALGLFGGGVYLGLLAVGLLLAVWRFVLFGV